MEDENDFPEQYKVLLKKIEALEKALGLKEVEKFVQDKVDVEREIFEETISEDDLQIQQKNEIVISPKAYLKLAKHALTYANKNIPKKDWVEVIGLVTGRIRHEDTPLEQIFVEDYWPVDQGDAISVEIVDQRIFTEIFHKKDQDHFIIGWAHSHPSYSPFLSDDDFRTHLRYQTFWNKSIAIVLDPLMISPKDFGVGVFRIHQDKKSYHELTNEIDGLSSEANYESINLFMKNMYGNDS
jgi:proteasome lid subunit RPN8/RPN11